MNGVAMVPLGYLSPQAMMVITIVIIILNQDSSHEVASIFIASSLIAYSYFMDGLELLKHHIKVINFFNQTIIVITIVIGVIVLNHQDFRSIALVVIMDMDGNIITTIIAKLDSVEYCCFV